MIVGIDPSLTNTAVIRGDEHGYEYATFGSGNELGDSASARIARYDGLVSRVMEWIGDGPFQAIYIEGYSFDSHGRGKFSAEYGGILRWHLDDVTDRLFEVAPHTLKKFATGKGAGKKDMVIAHLARRYDVLFNSNDEYDGFALYRLGLLAEGLAEPDNQAQREAADKVLGIDTPKPAKKRKATAPDLF